ncbi:FKBP-type peptidyl-prolyl cis-trans isomerase [uncultured Vibrio sp.]|uniref:FKBP-type peptidyl-prolyl cis-trans isomerase n=1 Tax=uncultured Vibrio sp. TaxID=114054 RepID=UPI0009207B5B|nr:FKBP-type peptidyl-prolyl cis-trans isomerase [uncultured Vibrio sp.]OIQ22241.1 MAG: peptidylprolyl isomerase [Vibrio sp. MedPE-SWchi]
MNKFIIPIVIIVLAVFFLYRSWNNGKLAEVNQAQGEAFLAENSAVEGVITTESGLQYQVLQKGTGEINPTATSRVKVHYHGTLIDGTVFDSSVERNEPIAFGLNQVIKGWTEGVQLMVEGDKFRLFVPSNLGYGKGGTGPIPPASVLIFDVELLEIQ